MTLRLFKDVGFTFVGRNTLRTCYVPNFGYDYETQMHGTNFVLNRVEMQNTSGISNI